MMPDVSVILPCHNAAPYLDDCITSLSAQTLTNLEVLAVDDGSTDETPGILNNWAARDARVRVFTPGRIGLVPALTLAAQHARAELLARMDADDCAAPQRLQMQRDLLEQQPAVSACGTGVCYFPRTAVQNGAIAYQNWLNGLHQPDQLARDIFVECPIAHPALMVRRSAFNSVSGYLDPDWPEDYDLILRLWLAGHQLANVPVELHHWREHAQRASRTSEKYSAGAFRRCKVHYLVRSLLLERAVVVWGAGPVGKAFARELLEQGARLSGFIDVDPRKIGQRLYGVPVWPASHCRQLRDDFLVAAVGSHSARAKIRAALQAAGHVELRDFCAVA